MTLQKLDAISPTILIGIGLTSVVHSDVMLFVLIAVVFVAITGIYILIIAFAPGKATVAPNGSVTNVKSYETDFDRTHGSNRAPRVGVPHSMWHVTKHD
jgi:hypothetical protein